MADELEVSQLLQEAVVRGLYARDGIFSLIPDYSYLIRGRWATSVDFPRNPQVYVGKGAVTKASGNRTKIKAGMDKHNVPFEVYTIAITEEAEANLMSDGQMADSTIGDAVDSLGDTLDVEACKLFGAAIPAAQIIKFAGGVAQWKDMITGSATARALKIGASSLLYLVPPALEPEVKDIDVIKLAISNNANYFENGIGKVDNNFYAFTSAVPQVGSKDAILIVNLRYTGRAIKKWMTRKDAYDRDSKDTDIDYLSYIAMDKVRSEAVIALTK